MYNQGFEEGKLKDLQRAFPEVDHVIDGIRKRLKDLMIPFKNKWYYTAEMKGSYSIKYVLPALVAELSYEDLEIKEGGLGSFKGDIQRTREALKAYCKMDTWGMVEIIRALQRLVA